jgi:hypothetical protein
MFTCLQEDGVAEAHIWGSGLVVRTIGKSQLFAIVDWVDHRVRKLADPRMRIQRSLNQFGDY